MKKHALSELQERLDALFIEPDVSGEGDAASLLTPTQMHAQLRESSRARDRYDQLATASRALEGDLEQPSRFERRFAEQSFLGALDAMLDAEQAPSASPQQQPAAEVIPLATRRRFTPPAPRVVFAAAATLMVSLGAATLLRDTPATPGDPIIAADDDAFQARSARSIMRTPASRDTLASVEPFCVERTAEGPRFTSREDAPFGVLACPLDADLKLAYTSPSHAAPRYIAAFGVSATGQILWYGPTPARPEPILIRHATQPEPLGDTLRLAINHAPGTIRLHTITSQHPLNYANLERALRVAAARAPLFTTESLELDELSARGVSLTFDVLEADHE